MPPADEGRDQAEAELRRRLGPADGDARTRLLAVVIAAVGPARWPLLAAAVARARTAGVPRAQVEETLLQATLFFGFPRVVTAFEQLEQAWPQPDPAPARSPAVPAAQRPKRGREVFAAVYGQRDEPVRAMLRAFHPEFHDFVLEAAYGRVLARPGLDLRTRELLAVAALCALDQVPQLVAHGRGALRCGADRQAVGDALRCGGADATAIDRLLRRVTAR